MIDYKPLLGRKGGRFTATVDAVKVKEYAAAIDDWSDFFWVDDPAAQCVPPTFGHLFRSGKMQAMEGVDWSRLVQGEQDIVYHRPLRVGERVNYEIEVEEVTEKEGRGSGPLAIIVLRTVLRDDAGEPIQTIRQTFVARR